LAIGAVLYTLSTSHEGRISVAVTTQNDAQLGPLSVLVDGIERCSQMPCEVTGLASGAHTVRVSAEGFEATADRAVAVRGDAPVRMTLQLTPKPPTGARVLAEGSALRVLIDGTDRGAPPVLLHGLAPGRHRLRIVDYQGLLETYEQTFQVTPEKVTELAPRLKIKRGQLTILPGENAEGAVVRLESQATEQTIRSLPVTLELPPVRYSVTAFRRGYPPFEEYVDFADGVAEQGIVVRLKPWGYQGTAAQTQTTKTAEEVVAPAASVDPDEPGVLDIGSSPAAAAILDGMPIGYTPKTGLRVSPGQHTVVFVHRTYGRKTATVVVQPGQKAVAMARFESGEPTSAPSAPSPEAEAGVLHVLSTLPAAVLLDGVPIGYTPKSSLRVPPGPHTLVFVHPKQGRRIMTVEVAAGKETTATARFAVDEPRQRARNPSTGMPIQPGF
jgi:hypothetical protein